MNKWKNYLGLAVLAICLFLASCSDKDKEQPYSKKVMANNGLKAILQQKGYQFNAQGNLVLDDLAKNTLALDLSGTKLSDFSGLELLPNLKEVKLSDNGYDPSFDFSKLPAQITGIDLRGNNIHDYINLVKTVVQDNGDETVENLRNITKLYLPEFARNNCTDLVRFYRKNKDAIDKGAMDVKMADAKGELHKYTTLRNIPDPALRKLMKTQFSSIFQGDQIDLSKRLNTKEKLNILSVNKWSAPDVTNIDGVQYIVENPSWEGTFFGVNFLNKKMEFPMRMHVGNKVGALILYNITMPRGIDLSNAAGLTYMDFQGCPKLASLDLSKNPIWGQREQSAEENPLTGSILYVCDCPDLTDIKFPEKEGLVVGRLDIEYLNKLKSLDLVKFKMIANFAVGDLPPDCDLKYPNLTLLPLNQRCTFFTCSEKTNALPSTKAFIKKYYRKGKDNMIEPDHIFACKKNVPVDWSDGFK